VRLCLIAFRIGLCDDVKGTTLRLQADVRVVLKPAERLFAERPPNLSPPFAPAASCRYGSERHRQAR